MTLSHPPHPTPPQPHTQGQRWWEECWKNEESVALLEALTPKRWVGHDEVKYGHDDEKEDDDGSDDENDGEWNQNGIGSCPRYFRVFQTSSSRMVKRSLKKCSDFRPRQSNDKASELVDFLLCQLHLRNQLCQQKLLHVALHQFLPLLGLDQTPRHLLPMAKGLNLLRRWSNLTKQGLVTLQSVLEPLPPGISHLEAFCFSFQGCSFLCRSNFFQGLLLKAGKHWDAKARRSLVQDLSQLKIFAFSRGDCLVKVLKGSQPGRAEWSNLCPQAHQIPGVHQLILCHAVALFVHWILQNRGGLFKPNSDPVEKQTLCRTAHRQSPVYGNCGLADDRDQAAVLDWVQVHHWFQEEKAHHTQSFTPRAEGKWCILQADHHFVDSTLASSLEPMFDGVLLFGVQHEWPCARLVLRSCKRAPAKMTLQNQHSCPKLLGGSFQR